MLLTSTLNEFLFLLSDEMNTITSKLQITYLLDLTEHLLCVRIWGAWNVGNWQSTHKYKVLG